MSVNAAAIFWRALTILQDEDAIRWTYPELRQWLNDALREVTLLKPTASSKTAIAPLSRGTHQRLPDEFTRILRVTRNMRSALGRPQDAGSIIRQVSRDMLDTQNPNWHDERWSRPGKEVRNAFMDDMEPTAFWVYPPSDGTGFVEVIAAKVPAGVPTPAQNVNEISSYDFNVSLPDTYANILLDYVLYRAFSKDAQFAGSATRAAAHFAQFINSMKASIGNDLQLSFNAPPIVAPAGAGK